MVNPHPLLPKRISVFFFPSSSLLPSHHLPGPRRRRRKKKSAPISASCSHGVRRDRHHLALLTTRPAPPPPQRLRPGRRRLQACVPPRASRLFFCYCTGAHASVCVSMRLQAGMEKGRSSRRAAPGRSRREPGVRRPPGASRHTGSPSRPSPRYGTARPPPVEISSSDATIRCALL